MTASLLHDCRVLRGLRQHNAVHAIRPHHETSAAHRDDGSIFAPQAPAPHGILAAFQKVDQIAEPNQCIPQASCGFWRLGVDAARRQNLRLKSWFFGRAHYL